MDHCDWNFHQVQCFTTVTYLKLISVHAKPHLVLPNQELQGVTSLCGCTIIEARGWKAITALEGDECEKCADLSFSSSRLGNSLETNN